VRHDDSALVCRPHFHHLNNMACADKDSILLSISMLEKAVGIYDANPLYHSNMGVQYARKSLTAGFSDIVNGNTDAGPALDSAIISMRKAVGMSEWETAFNVNLCILEYVSGRTAEALELITPYTKRQDAWPSVLCLAGMLEEKAGDCRTASGLYVRALCSSPSLFGSQFYMDLKRRDPDMAAEVMNITKEHLSSLYDGDPLDAARLGCVLWMDGDADAAEHYLNYALNELPSMNRPWVYLGQIAESRMDSLTAVSCYRKAAELDSGDPVSVMSLGRFDREFRAKAELMETKMVSEYSLELRSHFGTASLSDPFVVRGFEKYFTFTPNIQE